MPETKQPKEPYTEPSEEDLAEFGQEASKAAWSNLCWLYT